MPSSCVGWSCDLCREECPAQCMFDVHPLCTMLPQTIRSPLHPAHDLCMVPAVKMSTSGSTAAAFVSWNCTPRVPTGSGEQSTTTAQGSSASQTSSGGQSLAVTPSRRSSVVKFLLKTSFHVAINAATGGLASPVLEVPSAAFCWLLRTTSWGGRVVSLGAHHHLACDSPVALCEHWVQSVMSFLYSVFLFF
jgi:hypothetical protein